MTNTSNITAIAPDRATPYSDPIGMFTGPDGRTVTVRIAKRWVDDEHLIEFARIDSPNRTVFVLDAEDPTSEADSLYTTALATAATLL